MTSHPADQSSPPLKPHAPALLRLWTAAALPLHAEVAAQLRSLLTHVAILGAPGLAEAARGDTAMASKLALVVMQHDDTRRDLAMTALLLHADENGACRLILEHARLHERRRLIERAVEQALSPPRGRPAECLPNAPSVQI